jgi:hypothetical protein
VLEGRARLAFYRVGHRPIPLFGVPFLRIVSGQRGVLVSDSAYVDIESVAPAGNPTLRDIKEIERERWPVRGEVDRHYEAVADVARRYLEDGHGIPALERTTGELVWALPTALADGGLRDRCAALPADADLVKFARHRPADAVR